MNQKTSEQISSGAYGRFSNRLDYFIRMSGRKKADVADAVGVSGNRLTQYLKWRCPVPHEIRQKFADILDLPVEVLFPLLNDKSSSSAENQDIIEEQRLSTTEGDVASMNPLRRQLLGAAFLIPSLDMQLLARLSNVYVEPNRSSLAYLEMQMERSWQDRNKRRYPPSTLMPDAVTHLQQALMLVEHPSTLRSQFLIVASVNAILVGDSLYEMGDFQAARQMYKMAVDAAHKAEDRTLEAVAWGWRCFAWIYDNRPQEALKCVQRGRLVAASQPNVEVKGWLAAIEAEVQAVLGNAPASLDALKSAAKSELPSNSSRDSFWIHFDPTRLGGYQGICYLRLAQQDDKHSFQFVDRAQTILGSTIESLDKTAKEGRSTIFADFAQTFALQGDSKQACKYGTECFHILARRNFGCSFVAIARLQALKKQLLAQRSTSEVEEFVLLLNALPG